MHRKHKVLACSSADELEAKLNACLGFVVQRMEIIPNGMSVIFFAHLLGEEVKVEVAEEKPLPAPTPEKKMKPRAPDVSLDDRKEVHELWATLFKKQKTRFRTNGMRDKKIVKAIKEYGKEDVIKSIQGHSMNEWRHGAPNRCELATLLRNEQNIEAGMEIFDKGGVKDDFQRAFAGNRTIDFSDESRKRRGGVSSFANNMRD
tara:strand:- start:2662 stop:3270 length:609 start_codon:yes stop_codon:yes gene_type:complete